MQLSVINLRKLVVKAAAQIDADRIRVLPQQCLQLIPVHDSPGHHTLVGHERVILADIHTERVDDLLCFQIPDPGIRSGRFTGLDGKGNERRFLYIAKF